MTLERYSLGVSAEAWMKLGLLDGPTFRAAQRALDQLLDVVRTADAAQNTRAEVERFVITYEIDRASRVVNVLDVTPAESFRGDGTK